MLRIWRVATLTLDLRRITTLNLDLRRIRLVSTLGLALKLSDLHLGVLVALITRLGLRRSLSTLVGVALVPPLRRRWSLPTLVRVTVRVHDELGESVSRLGNVDDVV